MTHTCYLGSSVDNKRLIQGPAVVVVYDALAGVPDAPGRRVVVVFRGLRNSRRYGTTTQGVVSNLLSCPVVEMLQSIQRLSNGS